MYIYDSTKLRFTNTVSCCNKSKVLAGKKVVDGFLRSIILYIMFERLAYTRMCKENDVYRDVWTRSKRGIFVNSVIGR